MSEDKKNYRDNAAEKLKSELDKAKDKTFADPIINYLVERCMEDKGLAEDVCQDHKTWEKCFDYIYKQAREYAQGSNQCAVRDDTVFEWAEDYYHRDDKAEEEEKARRKEETEKHRQENANKNAKKQRKAKSKNDEVADNNKTGPEPVKSKPTEEVKVKSGPSKNKNKKNADGQVSLFDLLGV